MVDTSESSMIVRLGQGATGNAMYPAIAQVEAYWDALYDGHSVPRRTDIDPRALDQALSFTFVLEQIAPGVGRFRLAGAHLNDIMGLEVRGMPLTAMFMPEARDQIAKLIENICTTPAISQVLLVSTGGFGQPKLMAKMLLAPLMDDEGRVTRILGCLQCHGKIGRQPRRFTISDVATRALSASPSQTFAPTRPRAFAEAPARFIAKPGVSKQSAPAPQTTKPEDKPRVLRLVVNNC